MGKNKISTQLKCSKFLKKYDAELLIIFLVCGVIITSSFFIYDAINQTELNSSEQTFARVSNPSAVYCEGLEYIYKIETAPDGGQYGICIFPDGRNCSGWSFFRGECGNKYSYCEKRGGSLITEEQGTSRHAVCTLPAGIKCKEFDYFKGLCP